jgi:hypothetical protein
MIWQIWWPNKETRVVQPDPLKESQELCHKSQRSQYFREHSLLNQRCYK